MRAGLNSQQLAGAFKVYFVAIENLLEGICRGIRRVSSKNFPDGWIFRAQPPQREASRIVTTSGPHLVEGSHAVKEPDSVMRAVLFVVLVMRIACGRIKFDLSFRVFGINDRLLKTHFLRISTFSPVVTIVAQRHDRLCGRQLAHPAGQGVFIPVLRSDRARSFPRPVLVIGHQHEIVSSGGVFAVVPFRIVKRNCLHHHPTMRLKRGVQFLHELEQVRLGFVGRFFKIHANAGELVLLDELGQGRD